ncbi:hypothetical protein [Streptomyces sp. CJ_13]|uniref:hypothetical protein n=1 Tax=Streptomyces sp. CJ_13 TaxID=2724943 RepID=UPI0035B2C50F
MGLHARSKADKDPAQWLPPVGGYRCEYAAQWTATKLRWASRSTMPSARAGAGLQLRPVPARRGEPRRRERAGCAWA